MKYSSVTLIFCSDDFIRDYNNKYLKHNYETDILTFSDVDQDNAVEAELFISVDTVKSNSATYKTRFENELYRVIIHGILHSCGYDDKTRMSRKTINDRENFYLNQIYDAGKSN